MISIFQAVPMAHAGHWFAGLLYLMPVFILAGGILWQRRNDRRATATGRRIADEDVPFTDE